MTNTNTIQQLYNHFLQSTSVCTDTRKVKKGDIFFALKGENFNGNLFALQAIESGAVFAVIDENVDAGNNKLFLVKDVLTTLQDLAKHHRQQFNIPFIAITGSNGKTTTKELVSAALSTTYITYTTQGNLNNHIGVPLTILSIKKDAQMAVIEMGANHQKEIESYCQYTMPTHAIITNCGKAHLEGFGGVAGVKKGKGELYSYIKNNNGTAFVFWDIDYLKKMSKGIEKIVKYGTNEGLVIGNIKDNNPFLSITINIDTTTETIATNLVGDYNFSNVLTAVTVATFFKVPSTKIKAAIEDYTPSNSRSQLIEKGRNRIILDAYNANPSSMKAAIENFAKLQSSNKILMLGGMMELGEDSVEEHHHIIDLINQYSWKKVVLVGGDFERISHNHIYFENVAQAAEWFKLQDYDDCNILIKGSRSIKMEKILEN